MALDASARQANVVDSVRKFFIDNVKRNSGIPLGFDVDIPDPKIQGNTTRDKWVIVNFGQFVPATVSLQMITIACCARNDTSGFKVIQLRDTVMSYLFPNGIRATIDLYQSSQNEAWVKVGGMLTSVINESAILKDTSEVKYKIIDVDLKWGAVYEG